MIRMSTTQMYNTGMNNMMQSYSRVSTVNNQMGAGKRVLSPADDPVAAAQTLNTKARVAVVQQYNRNVDFADKNLSMTESVLNQVQMSLVRLKESAIQLGSGQWSEEQIKSSGIEAKEILSHLQGLLNTKNESGEYIFSGSQADKKAYDGNSFQGDRIEREVQAADDTFIKMLTSGARAFEGLEGLKTKSDPVAVTPTATYDPAAPNMVDMDSYLSKGDVLKFRSQLEDASNASVLGADDFAEWLVSDEAGVFSFPPGATEEVKKDWLDDNWAEIRKDMPAPWSGLDLTYDAGTNTYTGFDSAFDPADVDLKAPDIYQNNMLSVIQYFVDALGDGGAGDVNRDAIRASIDNLDVAFEQVSQVRSQIGARQNTLEAVKSSNIDFEDFAKQSISELEDLDYADAYMRLQTSMLSYQAGMQVMSRVSGLSLFNYI